MFVIPSMLETLMPYVCPATSTATGAEKFASRTSTMKSSLDTVLVVSKSPCPGVSVQPLLYPASKTGYMCTVLTDSLSQQSLRPQCREKKQ